MADVNRPLLADLEATLDRLKGDVRRMAELRWDLARLELDSDRRLVKRLVPVLAAAGVTVLTGLPLVAAAAAWWLGGCWGLSTGAWLLIFGLGLMGGGAGGGYLAWRSLCRRIVLLEQTRQELAEDLVWLRDWAGH